MIIKKLNSYLNYFIIAFLLVINFFWLPTFSRSIYSQFKTSDNSKISQELSSYKPPPQPNVKNNFLPQINTGSYILIDNATNKILASKNPQEKIYPASTTKLATAITALNLYPLDEIITIKQSYHQGKVVGFQVGEKLTVKSLVTALLVYSGNDAAFNLASHHPHDIAGFITNMNQLMAKFNLKNTSFINYDGLHSPNHYSTVYDLSQLGRIALKNPIIVDVVKNKKNEITDVSGQIKHELVSTNELLDKVPEIEGLKTGWTPEAGGCFVGLLNINGHKLISVVAQSEDRFGDTQKILEWAKQTVVWE